MEQLDIKSLYEEELKEKMISLGEKPFKGKQLYQWLHQKAAGSYEEMTNLSEGLRKKLTEQEPLTHLEVVEVQTSKIDGTQKYLFQLADGNVIESVWMQYKHGNSVCISSQVGCRMGCRFCASTIGGLTRNLLPSEMLDQVYRIQELTGGAGMDLIIETAGTEITTRQAIHMAKKGSTIVLVGYSKSGEMTLPMSLVLDKELTFKTVFRYRHISPIAIDAVASGKVNVKGIVTNIYDLDDVQRAMDESVHNKADIVKGVIKIHP